MRSSWASNRQMSRISPSDSGSRSSAGEGPDVDAGLDGGGPASISTRAPIDSPAGTAHRMGSGRYSQAS